MCACMCACVHARVCVCLLKYSYGEFYIPWLPFKQHKRTWPLLFNIGAHMFNHNKKKEKKEAITLRVMGRGT